MKVTSQFHYDSAHYLPLVEPGHKCGRMHGHTYILTVTIHGPVNGAGWVADFADVKYVAAPLIGQLDHRLLNDVIDNPTVENQLLWFWEHLAGLPLHELTLREGLNNSATYQGDNQ
jgi:6-pyruvoyltetrahydropterin/6-carboxytetrahydropterin synthase